MPKPTDQELMGVAEVAKYCSTSRSAVSNWLKRGKTPEPAIRLAMGPIWWTKNIVAWWEAKHA
jgi:predicted DNA-binding transcriptional regulator AlpA